MSQRGRVWLAIVIVAAVVRLATLPAYPLHDTTEARYSEIARLMVSSGDWITPQISAGVPFWAFATTPSCLLNQLSCDQSHAPKPNCQNKQR